MRFADFPHIPVGKRFRTKRAGILAFGAALAITGVGVAHAGPVINPEEGIWFVDSIHTTIQVQNSNGLSTGIDVFGGKTGLHARGGDAAGGDGTGQAVYAEGFGDDARGLRAEAWKMALEARSTSTTGDGTAIRAEGGKKAGGFGAGVLAIGDEAVVARGTSFGIDATGSDTAVAGVSDKGIGGFFAGKQAPIRLAAAGTAGAPTSGLHHRGELYVDSAGVLFYCTTDGTPGTWKQVVLK
jgi:hypothetical protein